MDLKPFWGLINQYFINRVCLTTFVCDLATFFRNMLALKISTKRNLYILLFIISLNSSRLPTVWKKKHQNNDDNAEKLFHFVLAFILIIFSLNLLLVPSLICYRSCTRVFPTPFYYNQVIQISFSRRTDLYPLIYGYSQNQNWACRWTV